MGHSEICTKANINRRQRLQTKFSFYTKNARAGAEQALESKEMRTEAGPRITALNPSKHAPAFVVGDETKT